MRVTEGVGVTEGWGGRGEGDGGVGREGWGVGDTASQSSLRGSPSP